MTSTSTDLVDSPSPQFSAAPMPRGFGIRSAAPDSVRSGITENGTLLTDRCATPQYTLIDYGPTASYVPFIGCMNTQLECCPFSVVTATTTNGITVTTQGVYPQPKDAKDAIVKRCPTDYHSAPGGCCPSSYSLWSTELGGSTPCYSTLSATPPPMSSAAGDAVAARATSTRPTVTVTTTIFAMQYAVLADGAAVSPGGIAGGLIGCALVVGAFLALVRWCRGGRRDVQDANRLSGDMSHVVGGSPGTSVIPTALPVTPIAPPSLLRAPSTMIKEEQTPPPARPPPSRPPPSRMPRPVAYQRRLERIHEDPPVTPRSNRSRAPDRSSMYVHAPTSDRGSPVPGSGPRPPSQPRAPDSPKRRAVIQPPADWRELYAHGPRIPPIGGRVAVYSGKPKLGIPAPGEVEIPRLAAPIPPPPTPPHRELTSHFPTRIPKRPPRPPSMVTDPDLAQANMAFPRQPSPVRPSGRPAATQAQRRRAERERPLPAPPRAPPPPRAPDPSLVPAPLRVQRPCRPEEQRHRPAAAAGAGRSQPRPQPPPSQPQSRPPRPTQQQQPAHRPAQNHGQSQSRSQPRGQPRGQGASQSQSRGQGNDRSRIQYRDGAYPAGDLRRGDKVDGRR